MRGTAGSVAITGASGQVGTLLGERLAADGVETVALNAGDDWAGPISAAKAVAHLAGTLQPKGDNTYERANVETTERVAAAAGDSGVERIAFLSYVGADPESPNAYLRSKAAAERILTDSGVPTTIFRCLHIYGPPEHPGPTADAFLARGRRPVAVLGNGRQRIAPLYIGDVVAALAAALLDRRTPTGVFELGGPEQMSMDDFVRRLNRGSARIMHLPAPAARALGHLSPALTPALVDLLLADNTVADPGATADRFGFTPERVERIYASGTGQ